VPHLPPQVCHVVRTECSHSLLPRETARLLLRRLQLRHPEQLQSPEAHHISPHEELSFQVRTVPVRLPQQGGVEETSRKQTRRETVRVPALLQNSDRRATVPRPSQTPRRGTRLESLHLRSLSQSDTHS
jgi:hypothetical protein